MAREWLVAVSYPADDEFTQINTGMLDCDASVVFLERHQEDERREILRQVGRASAVRDFIDYALQCEGVSFMRRIDIARYWQTTYPPPTG